MSLLSASAQKCKPVASCLSLSDYRSLYREELCAEGIERRFSGWTLTAGDESDDYCDDPENWHFVSLGAVLNIDDGFRKLLDLPFTREIEYVWNVQTKQFDEHPADD